MFTILKHQTKHGRLQGAEGQKGAPSGRLAGGWLDDLATLKKAIVLCHRCVKKFNYKAYGYKRSRILAWDPFVLGDCDGCGVFQQGNLFLSEGEHGSQRAP